VQVTRLVRAVRGYGERITREKQIKAGSRKKKLALIEALNPDWRDLYPMLL
jgi:predicted GIY-YIG superfamily endonuclease